jgi:hypothetical protein
MGRVQYPNRLAPHTQKLARNAAHSASLWVEKGGRSSWRRFEDADQGGGNSTLGTPLEGSDARNSYLDFAINIKYYILLHGANPNSWRRTPVVKHSAGRCHRFRHSASKNARLKRQVAQLRHTFTRLRTSKAESNDSGGQRP